MKIRLTIKNVEYDHEEVKVIESTDMFHELMRIRGELNSIMITRYPYSGLFTMLDVNEYTPNTNVIMALIFSVSDGYSQSILYKIKLEEEAQDSWLFVCYCKCKLLKRYKNETSITTIL